MTTSILSPTDPLMPPAANLLWVSDNWNNSLGTAPTFAYKLQVLYPAVGKPEDKDFAPERVIDTGIYANVTMIDVQWQKWPADADDREYILNCLCANLNLVRAK